MTDSIFHKILARKKFIYDVCITLSSSALIWYCAATQYHILFLLTPFLVLRFIYLYNSFNTADAQVLYDEPLTNLPSYAIIICAYNESSENLELLLSSIAASSMQPRQLIIVDDGSTSPVQIDTAKYANAQLIHNPVNIGKKRCQGVAIEYLLPVDYILYLDSDIYFDATAVERSLKYIHHHKDGNVFGVRILIRDFKQDYLNTLIHTSYHADYNKRIFESHYGVTTSCNGAFMFCNYHFMLQTLDAYLNETLLGNSIPTGDDKSLTNFALQSGKSYTIPGVSVTHESFKLVSYIKKIQRTFKTSIVYQVRAIFLNHVAPLVRLFSVLDMLSFFTSVPLQVIFIVALFHLPYFYVYAAAYILFLAIRNNGSILKVLSYAVFRFSFMILLYLLRLLTLFRIRTIGWGNR